MRKTFADTVIDYTIKNEKAIILSGDAGLGIFCDFKEKYPDKFLNMGIAEQNMMSFAAGLAITGYKVFCYNIIPFIFYRCYEQIRNDICYQELPVVLIGTGSGVTYAPQGITHYAVEDISLARTLPNLTVLSPADPIETKLSAEFATCADGPVYVRVAKSGEKNINDKENFNITKAQLLQDGEEIALLFHGSISQEIIFLNGMLKKEKIKIKLISVPMVQPLNVKQLLELIGDVKKVISVEEHFTNSGLGSVLEPIIMKHKSEIEFEKLGISPEYIHLVKDTSGMREYYNISANKLYEKIKTKLSS